MELLHWIGVIVICFWILGLIFSFGGSMLHVLLFVAVILFAVDKILRKKLT